MFIVFLTHFGIKRIMLSYFMYMLFNWLSVLIRRSLIKYLCGQYPPINGHFFFLQLISSTMNIIWGPNTILSLLQGIVPHEENKSTPLSSQSSLKCKKIGDTKLSFRECVIHVVSEIDM